MDRARTLAVTAQLGAGVAGMVVALRRVHPYDVFWMHGQPDAIARDTLFKGTALSAPVSTLVTQAALTAAIARRPSRHAARGCASSASSWWPATWASGWCGNGFAHLAGTRSSRP
jgi:hypothetical protein